MRVLRELLRRPLSLFGTFVIALVLILALCAPWLAPYAPDDQLFEGLSLEGAPLPPMLSSGSARIPSVGISSPASCTAPEPPF
jgi:ABC-type antimicrobial peptide transport system permease subunit